MHERESFEHVSLKLAFTSIKMDFSLKVVAGMPVAESGVNIA